MALPTIPKKTRTSVATATIAAHQLVKDDVMRFYDVWTRVHQVYTDYEPFEKAMEVYETLPIIEPLNVYLATSPAAAPRITMRRDDYEGDYDALLHKIKTYNDRCRTLDEFSTNAETRVARNDMLTIAHGLLDACNAHVLVDVMDHASMTTAYEMNSTLVLMPYDQLITIQTHGTPIAP